MFGFLRRPTRLALAAGAFSLGSLALAGPTSPPSTLPGAVHASPEQARAEAVKVELALMADSTTFALGLEVHAKGDHLELRGPVRDDASRRRALEVARQACYLPVHDAMSLPQGVATSDQELAHAARAALIEHLGANAIGMVLTVYRGQVALQGQVDTPDRKMLASRCLRRVAGVKSIDNRLAVTVKGSDPGAVTPQPAVSETAVQPTGHALNEAKPASAPATTAVPRVQHVTPKPYVLPSGLPSGKSITVRPHEPRDSAESVLPNYLPPRAGYVSPPLPPAPDPVTLAPSGAVLGSPGKGSCPGKGKCAPAVQPTARPGFLERLMPFRNVKRDRCGEQPVVLYPNNQPETTTKTETVSSPTTEGKSSPRPVAEPAAQPETVSSPAAVVLPAPRPVEPKAPVTTKEPQVFTTPISRPLADVGGWKGYQPGKGWSPVQREGVKEKTDTPALVEPTKSEPIVPTVAKQTAKTGTSPAPTATPARDEASRPVPVVPATMAGKPISTTQLVQVIKKTCGKLVQEVRVETTPAGTVVHVHAAPAAEQKLVSQLLSIPEVITASVKLQVHLAK